MNKQHYRFLAYCVWSNELDYHLLGQMCMYQASVQRKFYLWSSFGPREIRGNPVVNHLTDKFLMFYRCTNRDLPGSKLVELYLMTNDPVYGSMMELDESSTEDRVWHDHESSMEAKVWHDSEPTLEDLKGLWIHSLNSWNCRGTQASSNLVQQLQEAAYETVGASTKTE